jgi:hypothetical protein
MLKVLAAFIFKSVGNNLFSSKLFYFLAMLEINVKIDCL